MQPKRPTFRQVVQVVFLLLERPQLGDRRQSKAKRLKTSNFEKDCQRMTIMMGPVTTALALTVVYVKALGLRPEGSEPFQPLLPRP